MLSLVEHKNVLVFGLLVVELFLYLQWEAVARPKRLVHFTEPTFFQSVHFFDLDKAVKNYVIFK